MCWLEFLGLGGAAQENPGWGSLRSHLMSYQTAGRVNTTVFWEQPQLWRASPGSYLGMWAGQGNMAVTGWGIGKIIFRTFKGFAERFQNVTSFLLFFPFEWKFLSPLSFPSKFNSPSRDWLKSCFLPYFLNSLVFASWIPRDLFIPTTWVGSWLSEIPCMLTLMNLFFSYQFIMYALSIACWL